MSSRSRWRGLWLVAHCCGVFGLAMVMATLWPATLPLSMCHLAAADYERGAEFARLGIADAPGVAQLHGYLAMNLVGLGNIGAARDACAEARRLSPAWVERVLSGRAIFRKPEHLQRATTFLRIAAQLEDRRAADALR